MLSTKTRSAVPYILIFLLLLTSPYKLPSEIIISDSGLNDKCFPLILNWEIPVALSEDNFPLLMSSYILPLPSQKVIVMNAQ